MLTGNHIFWMMILSLLCSGAAIVTGYMSRWISVVLGYAALVLAAFSGYAYLDTSTLIFWGVASLIAIGISVLLPRNISGSRVGMAYFCTGALMGMMLGMLTNTSAGIITGTAIGVVLGSLAFSRVDKSNVLEFPSRRFFNYLCAKGLPLTVMMSMVAICILSILNASKSASL